MIQYLCNNQDSNQPALQQFNKIDLQEFLAWKNTQIGQRFFDMVREHGIQSCYPYVDLESMESTALKNAYNKGRVELCAYMANIAPQKD